MISRVLGSTVRNYCGGSERHCWGDHQGKLNIRTGIQDCRGMKLNTAERAGKTGQRGNDLQDGYEDHFPVSFAS
jgi:hypothetical protein